MHEGVDTNMSSSKKIYMILTNGFDPDVRVYKEAKYLVTEGFNVEIICWDRKCEYVDRNEEVIDGINIKRFCIPSKPGTGMKQIIPYIKFIKNTRKYLKDKEYSYLHCHDFDGIVVGMFTKNKKKTKIIFDMHEIYKNYSYARNIFFDFVFNKILKKSDYIIHVNEAQIEGMKSTIKEKTVFLPNYPESKVYEPIEKNASEKIRVNYIGALRDYESLNSLAKLNNNDKNIEVGLYGTGVCYDKLKEQYQGSNVKVYGKYNGITESGEIYRNTDILYCSYNPQIKNWKTSYPVKLFESIVTLTPVIVTENTVSGDFVEKYGIGKTIKYGDTESIINAILDIKQSYDMYVENIKNISDNYKWKNVVKNLKKVYKNLL